MKKKIREMRSELGLKHSLSKSAIRPESRGKSGAKLVRELRENK